MRSVFVSVPVLSVHPRSKPTDVAVVTAQARRQFHLVTLTGFFASALNDDLDLSRDLYIVFGYVSVQSQ